MTTARLTRSERAAVTRRELLAAAERRFFEDGYHGTSLDEIADEAGYTKGAVYSTFGSKAALFLAFFDEFNERRLNETRALMSGHETDEDALAALARQPADEANARFLLLAIEFWVHAAREPELLRAFAARHRHVRESFARWAPRTTVLGPERWAIATMALSNGLALERLIDPTGVPDDVMAAVQAQITGLGSAS